ncbi:MAG: hypothetical protein M2R45_04003 [Verrucomicrobia subdivision 3 bacterium]|nr:hypothetical protein [Limisphaerales bacterium]MCS1416246.1 hypothetical protein [Limisphaerales bacterium]
MGASASAIQGSFNRAFPREQPCAKPASGEGKGCLSRAPSGRGLPSRESPRRRIRGERRDGRESRQLPAWPPAKSAPGWTPSPMSFQKPGAILEPPRGEPRAFLGWTPVGATATGIPPFPALLQMIAFQKLNCVLWTEQKQGKNNDCFCPRI